jgi:hypothetical protein
MPTELQELQLRVSLINEASEGVAKLKEQLGQISGTSGKRAMDKLKEEQAELAKQVKELGELVTGGSEAMLGYIGKFGAAGIAMSGFATTLLVGLGSLKEWSDRVVDLTNKAKVIGMHPAELKSIIEQYERLGVSAGVVEQSMAGFSTTIAEINRIGGHKRMEMVEAAGQFGEVMEKGIERVEAQTDWASKLDQVLIQAQNVYDNRLAETKGNISDATKSENDFLKLWGLDPSVKVLKGIQRVSEEEKKRQEERSRLTADYKKQVTVLSQELESWGDDIKTSMLAADGTIVTGLKMSIELVKLLHEEWNKPWMGAAGRTLRSLITRGVGLTAIDLVKAAFGFHNEITDDPGTTFSQRFGQSQAPHAQTDFAEKLKKLGLERSPQNDYSQPAHLLSGPVGETTGSDQIPGIGKGWEWMRRSENIEDRRQIDETMVQGDEYIKYIQANTAETKRLNDNFRLLDRGEAVLRGLGGLPGFESGKNVTGGTYGGGGASGSWAAPSPSAPNGSSVGGGDGKGGGDSNPSSGKGGGSSSEPSSSPVEQSNPANAQTSVPQRFVSDLTAMTLAGAKPHNIHAYMLQHGINLSEATCGQFMSSVVKEHGGIPPKNPAVASNWNKFGGAEGAGYSNDPNAINIAVKQGASVGSTGSHVTSAVPITDASGKITGYRGVGVNQGKQGVAGVGQYGRDVISSIPLRIGTRPGEYQIRHQIVTPAADTASDDRKTIDQASTDKAVRTVKVETGGKLTADVNAPAGAEVKVEGGGAFSKTETNRTMPLQ